MKNPATRYALCAVIAGATTALACPTKAGPEEPPSKPHFDGQPPGEAQTIFRPYKGVMTAVDAKGGTITLKLPEGSHTFKTTAETKFTHAGKPASADAALGKQVELTAKTANGRPDEATSVDIKD
jgi:hypothetical protein